MDLHQNKTWADWLRQKAELGDKEAMTALRYRNRKKQSYALSGTSSNFSFTDLKHLDSITKEGTEIYKVGNGVIRNDGNEIKISKGASIDTLKKGIDMARQRYGDCIQVNGSPLFKKIITQISVQNDLPITFSDPGMEEEFQEVMKLLEQPIEKDPTEQSPTLSALDKARQPKVKTACETCPNSMWFSSPIDVKCYCRIMHMISWSGKDSNLITMCDGRFID